jgi:NTP pyrophosphatase (non-canonical NTP hydrolase)
MSKTIKIYEWLETAGKKFGDKTQLNLAISLVEEELQELKEAVANNDIEEIKDAVIDLDWVTRNVTFYSGILAEDLRIMSNKVEISNFSKFCTSEEEGMKTVDKYKKEGVLTILKKVGKYFVVNRKDGKILKNINYLKVEDLK